MAGAGEMHDEARTVATEGERAIRNGETDKGNYQMINFYLFGGYVQFRNCSIGRGFDKSSGYNRKRSPFWYIFPTWKCVLCAKRLRKSIGLP